MKVKKFLAMSLKKSLPICKRYFNTGLRLSQSCEWSQPKGYNTDIFLYNHLTKKKSNLILKNENIATWYVCGPTVYTSAHIGHACAYVKTDIIRRILQEFFNINVLLVMNITDIDDKIIHRAHMFKEDWQYLAQYYELEFIRDMDSLNVLRPITSCKVTNFIPQIINFTKNIVEKDAAYVAQDGSVYFDVTKYNAYGKLHPPHPEGLYDPNKKTSMDFALWKAAKEGEPRWESPWGFGRPGWHIECSAIASTIFGNNIDMHSGGVDLIFPHHENEEAQSCCYHNTDRWVNYWLHTGHLTVFGGSKMSKSLNNAINIPSILERYTADEFRMFCLLSNYRNSIEFSDATMKKPCSLVSRVQFFMKDCKDFLDGKPTLLGGNINEAVLLETLQKTEIGVKKFLADDFNTANAIKSVTNLIQLTTKMMNEKSTGTAARDLSCIAAVLNFTSTFFSRLGFNSPNRQLQVEKMNKVLDTFVEFRNEVRTNLLSESFDKAQLLNSCDSIRTTLAQHGVHIRDQKETSNWTLRN